MPYRSKRSLIFGRLHAVYAHNILYFILLGSPVGIVKLVMTLLLDSRILSLVKD